MKTGLLKLFAIVCCCCVTTIATAQNDPSLKNILINGHAEDGPADKPAGWKINTNPSLGDDVVFSTSTDAAEGSRSLHIARKGNKPAHVWWYQDVAAEPATTYTFSFKGKGFADGEDVDHVISAGVYFRDAQGKWLGYKVLSTVAERQRKWPTSKVPDTREWKPFKSTFTSPAGTASLGIRLTLMGEGPSDAYFDDVQLTRPTVPMQDQLNKTPAELPHFNVQLKDVSSDGVTVRPDWSLDDAEKISSSVRQRVCLNGLWAVQPVAISAAPVADQWAFIKVPGRFRGAGSSFSYGKDQTEWRKTSLDKAVAYWLIRDVELPQGQGRVSVQIAAHGGFAIRAYWNGKPFGISTDQTGGILPLWSVAKPGERGQLALYALAVPTEEQTAHLIAAGKAERLYDPARRLAWQSEIWDVYAILEPEKQQLTGVRVIPSVRQKSLMIEWTNPSGGKGALDVLISDKKGQTALQVSGLTPQNSATKQSVSIPWTNARFWNPDDPFLYQARFAWKNEAGQIADETLPITFGFREMWVDGKNLMFNGHPLRLRPRMTLVYDPFMDDDTIRRCFSFFKDMGFNCLLRVPSMEHVEHLQVSEAYFNIADEMGFMLVPYTPYGFVTGGQFGQLFNASFDDSLIDYVDSRMMQRLVNHPSVIAYSGFGGGISQWAGNPYNCNPDWLGVKPLRDDAVVQSLIRDGKITPADVNRVRISREFIQRIKQRDPSRPFLSHCDTGQGDGWGFFDYFNWTPIQEWKEWPMEWAKNGVMPFGSWEHGLPYSMTFVNHAIPDGDQEPWVTEFSAGRLGPKAYALENDAYVEKVRATYGSNKISRAIAEPLVQINPNVDLVRAQATREIYRAWRTYGVPMGIEPFGGEQQYIQEELLLQRANKPVIHSSPVNLKTTGAKADRYPPRVKFLNPSSLDYPSAPTGKKPVGLNPLGNVLYENNRTFLGYIAGSARRFTAMDHTFWAGETIGKQIMMVWDGFAPLHISGTVTISFNGKVLEKRPFEKNLKPGDIAAIPLDFVAPSVKERQSGTLALVIRNAADGSELSHDDFAFAVFPKQAQAARLVDKKVVVLDDPAEKSSRLLRLLGVKFSAVTASQPVPKGTDFLVIGEGQLAQCKWRDLNAALAPQASILILQQTDLDLKRLGFRAYPMRTRQAFFLPGSHPVVRGLAEDDLRDWRVEPTLYPANTTPLRNGYNWRAGSYGTIASAVIEIPTSGNFTPLIQCEFDLAMTPLLATQLDGRQIVLCQLSLADVVGVDPAGTIVAGNLIEYMAETSTRVLRSVKLIGPDADASLLKQMGLSVNGPVSVGQMSSQDVAFVTDAGREIAALRQWVKGGGTAVLLGTAADQIASAEGFPHRRIQTRLMPISAAPLLSGLGQNDFHYRDMMDVATFGTDLPVADRPDGAGRWVFIGFDPRRIDLNKTPHLRLTQRRQYRVLSQIITNLNGNMSDGVRVVMNQIGAGSVSYDLASGGTIKVGSWQGDSAQAVNREPSAQNLQPFPLDHQQTQLGYACLEMQFTLPRDFAGGDLVADLGTVDDYDITYLNGTLLGKVLPEQYGDQGWQARRLYKIPAGLLKAGQSNTIRIFGWNRNAVAKGHKVFFRGAKLIRPENEPPVPYVGTYRHNDDPYLQYHW